jgi:uncharacterized membrane protein
MDVAQTPPRPFPRTLATGIALVGLLVSGALQVLHVRTYLVPDASSICTVGQTFDCNAVTLSRFSVVLGVPLPAWGALGFYALMVLAWRGSRLLVPLSGFAALASIALLAEELLHVGAVCMFCEAVHLLAVALFVVAWIYRDRLAAPTRNDWLTAVAVPGALWLGVRMFAPVYWSSVMWTRGVELPNGVDDDGNPWIGAESPTVTVHEYTDYACPHCRVGTGRMLRLVGRHPGELRLVRHQQPRLRCTDNAMSGCQMVRVALCAGDQGKFWETDSWLFAHGSGAKAVDIDAAAGDIGLDAAALRTCVDDPATQARAAASAKEARERGVKGTPGYVVDDAVVDVKELDALLDARL